MYPVHTLSGSFACGEVAAAMWEPGDAPVIRCNALDYIGEAARLNESGLRRILGAGEGDALTARAMASIDALPSDWWDEALMDPRDEDALAEEDALQRRKLGYCLADEDLI
jgi:hypothetical protein